MREKILKLRKQLMSELDKLEPGMVVSLSNYSNETLDLILFDGIGKSYTLNSEQKKELAEEGIDNIQKYIDDKGLVADRITSIDEYGKRAEKKVFALPIEYIEKINLDNVDFTNFVAREFDFSKLHGVNIDPQKVYHNDLSFSVLNNVNFIGSFDNASIRGANFSGSKNAKITPILLHASTTDTLFEKEKKAEISIEGCNFKDVTFEGHYVNGTYYGPEIEAVTIKRDSIKYNYKYNLHNVSFEGSHNAFVKIDKDTFISESNLKDATIISNHGINWSIFSVDFGGAKMVKNTSLWNVKKAGPVEIIPTENDYSHCKFNGVRFIGGFKNTCLSKCDFTGSEGANIDLRLLNTNSDVDSINFTDASVIGYDGKELIVTEDGRIAKKILNELDEKLNLTINNSIITSEEREKAYIQKIEDNKREIKETQEKLSELLNNMKLLGLSEEEMYGKITIEQEHFLVKVDDHYEINRGFIDSLRFLNLSMIDFTNVNVVGLDFRNTGARIDPQIVYKKDISNCVLDSGNIKFYDDPTDVIAEETIFEDCDFDLNSWLKRAKSNAK